MCLGWTGMQPSPSTPNIVQNYDRIGGVDGSAQSTLVTRQRSTPTASPQTARCMCSDLTSCTLLFANNLRAPRRMNTQVTEMPDRAGLSAMIDVGYDVTSYSFQHLILFLCAALSRWAESFCGPLTSSAPTLQGTRIATACGRCGTSAWIRVLAT